VTGRGHAIVELSGDSAALGRLFGGRGLGLGFRFCLRSHVAALGTSARRRLGRIDVGAQQRRAKDGQDQDRFQDIHDAPFRTAWFIIVHAKANR
jgi:hypothetical protein